MSLKDEVLSRLPQGTPATVVLHGLLMRLAKGKQPTKVFSGSTMNAQLCFVRSAQELGDELDQRKDPLIKSIGIVIRNMLEQPQPQHVAHEKVHAYLESAKMPATIVSIHVKRLKELSDSTRKDLRRIFPHSESHLYIVIVTKDGEPRIVC
jgi:hypothetical protein